MFFAWKLSKFVVFKKPWQSAIGKCFFRDHTDFYYCKFLGISEEKKEKEKEK